MTQPLSEYRLKTIRDRQRLEARKLRQANERVAVLEELLSERENPESMPDTLRVPTESDARLAGMLSTVWPMSTRHPQDSIHLAIFVNDLSDNYEIYDQRHGLVLPGDEIDDELLGEEDDPSDVTTEPEPDSDPDPCAEFGCEDSEAPVRREHTKDCPRFAEFEYAGGVEYLDSETDDNEDSESADEDTILDHLDHKEPF